MRKVVLVVAASLLAIFSQCCAASKDCAARTPPVDAAHCPPGAALKQHIDSALQCAPLHIGQRVESAATLVASDASGLHAAQDATRARPPATAAFKRRDVPAAAVRRADRSAPMTIDAAVRKCVPPSARAADSGARARESPPATPAAGHARKRRCARRSAEYGTPPGQLAAAASAPHSASSFPVRPTCLTMMAGEHLALACKE